MLRRTLALAASALLASTAHVDAAASSSAICQSAEFQALTPTALGSSPLLVRSLVSGSEVCFEFTLSSSISSAGWFAVGPAARASMVNSPTTNVMLFRSSVGKPESYVLGGYSSSEVRAESDQSFFVVHESSTAPLKFSYQRTLAASSSNDVAIDTSKEAQFIWAYGTSWPISSHRSGTMGTAKYTITTAASSSASTTPSSGSSATPSTGSSTTTFVQPSTPWCDDKNCPAIIGGLAFVVMLVGGFLLSAVIHNTPLGHAMLHKTLASPPVKATTNAPVSSPVVMFLQCLADLRLGEVLVVLIFVGAMAILVILNKDSTNRVTSGQAALLIMMFMILPVTRIPLWTFSFGSSFERIVKFHRWLGMSLSIATIIHLIQAVNVTKVTNTDKYGKVYPFMGFLAFVCFMLIALTANEFMRRRFFDVFYLSHRVLSIVGFVFTILHSAKMIGLALAVPLAFYVIGVVNTWIKSYSGSYQATVSVHEGTGVTTLLLNSTEKTKYFAQHMNLCSYFWIRIPTISGVQWHPFSAIVTPNGDSIGFCIRAMGPPDVKTFSRTLLENARTTHSLALNLCGPFGKTSVDVEKYDVIVLIGGGIGITPLLSAMNQHRLFAKKSAKAADWNVLWSARYPQDLLMVDELMPTQAQLQYSATNLQEPYQIGAGSAPALNATWNAHCSEEKDDGIVARANGEQIAYRAGMPVLDEYINMGRYMGRKVAVLACGPPTMVVEAQALARNCGFDFHKEVFHW